MCLTRTRSTYYWLHKLRRLEMDGGTTESRLLISQLMSEWEEFRRLPSDRVSGVYDHVCRQVRTASRGSEKAADLVQAGAPGRTALTPRALRLRMPGQLVRLYLPITK